MNNLLREMLAEFVKNPTDYKVIQGIIDLRPKDSDFSDELFESFSSEGKQEIYSGLPFWIESQNNLRILERRAKTETDPLCRDKVEGLLELARKW